MIKFFRKPMAKTFYVTVCVEDQFWTERHVGQAACSKRVEALFDIEGADFVIQCGANRPVAHGKTFEWMCDTASEYAREQDK